MRVTRQDGVVLDFAVRRTVSYPVDSFPSFDEILARTIELARKAVHTEALTNDLGQSRSLRARSNLGGSGGCHRQGESWL